MRTLALRTLASMVLAIAALISGCAGTIVHMQELAVDTVPAAPAPGKAAVVFLRPSFLGGLIQSSIFEVKDNQSLLVGIVAAKAKVAYEVEPGKHLFMVIGENADFMTADLLPNRTYYVQIEPRMGLWKARFGLKPVGGKELDTPEFKAALADCKWVWKTEAAENWARGNMASIQSKRADYYPDWVNRPEAEKPHLSRDDGSSVASAGASASPSVSAPPNVSVASAIVTASPSVSASPYPRRLTGEELVEHVSNARNVNVIAPMDLVSIAFQRSSTFQIMYRSRNVPTGELQRGRYWFNPDRDQVCLRLIDRSNFVAGSPHSEWMEDCFRVSQTGEKTYSLKTVKGDYSLNYAVR